MCIRDSIYIYLVIEGFGASEVHLLLLPVVDCVQSSISAENKEAKTGYKVIKHSYCWHQPAHHFWTGFKIQDYFISSEKLKLAEY